MNFNLLKIIKKMLNKKKDENKEKEFESKLDTLKKEINEIINDDNLDGSSKEYKLETLLSRIMELFRYYNKINSNDYISEKKLYGDEYDYIESILKDDEEIQKSIKFVREKRTYSKINKNVEEREYGVRYTSEGIIDIYGHFEKYYSKDNKDELKSFNSYSILENFISFIERNCDRDEQRKKIIKNAKISFINKKIQSIKRCKDVEEKMRLAREVLGNDLTKEFKKYFLESVEEDIKNRIILSEKGIEINSQEKCPKILEVIDRESLIRANDELAQKKLSENNHEVKKEDTVYLRLVNTDRISRLGLLEPIGLFSEPRKTDSFFGLETIKNAFPDENIDDYKQKTNQLRQTLHFTVNSLVSDHMYGKFSEGKIIYIVSADDIEDRAVNLLPSDSFITGNLKVKTALISFKNYKELMKDEKIAQELKRLDIILFDEEEIKRNVSDEKDIYQYAAQLYLNQQDKVFGTVSSFYYNFNGGKNAEKYLDKMNQRLIKEAQQKGIECGSHMGSKWDNQDINKSMKVMREEIKIMVEIIKEEAHHLLGEDFDYDRLKMALGYMNGVGIDGGDGQFYYEPETIELDKLYGDYLTDVLKKISPSKMKEIIGKYDEIIEKRYELERKKEDQKNLDERLITKEDFDEEYRVNKGGRDD